MIPIRLELTNFLSYRQKAVLDFDGIHLACVSGPNGAGKSSILDSITWALFGQSRSKSDDDVVNRQAALQGESAEVRLEFSLEGGVYRVLRRKKVGKTMVLELQMAAESATAGERRWKSLTESKLRETQTAVEQLLRMSFDTFSNASFLLQGKADEFTTRSPNQRKEILADLLGVNRWDGYKERVAGRRKDTEEKLLLLDGRISDIEQELAEQDEREKALVAAKAELKVIADQCAIQEQLLEQLRRAETAVKQQQQLVENLATTLKRAGLALEKRQQQQRQRRQERDNYQALLDQATIICADYAAWQEAEACLQEWQNKADAYHALRQQQRPHELQIERERSRLAQWQTELENQAQRIAAMERERSDLALRLQSDRPRLEQLGTRLAELAGHEAAWQEARDRLQQMESERRLWAQEAGQLQNQARRIENLQKEERDVVQNRAQAEKLVAQMAAEVAAVAERYQRHGIALAEMNNLQAAQPRLKAEMNKIVERLTPLQNETGGACPVCGQAMSESHRQAVVTELEAEGKQKGDEYRDNLTRIELLQKEIAALAAGLKQQEKLERDLQAQQQRLAKAEARLEEIHQAVAEWEQAADGPAARLAALKRQLDDQSALIAQQTEVGRLATAVQGKGTVEEEQGALQSRFAVGEARLAEIDRATDEWTRQGQPELQLLRQRLAEESIVPEAQAALKELEAQAAAIGYDASAHEATRDRRNVLAHAPTRHQELQKAEAAVKPVDETLADLERQISEQEAEVAELSRQHEAVTAQLAEMSANGGDLVAVEKEAFRLREAEIAAQRRVGAAQQFLAVLSDLRCQQEELAAQRAAVTLLIQRLKLLEKACGRDGVQALLIEQALPEIEEDANELLDRLTGGQMSVVFDTQRKLKSADRLAETLDIRIADAVGERPYENFSGGEQFRVNFAIRLALSRILAKRAGARLQTLVIDEGFGSQDPYGRQRLVEAINTIQGDFARILIITHIDELRDAFPTRIEVDKAGSGSTISVI
jgi:DNA repair protein SbcC/Rad50